MNKDEDRLPRGTFRTVSSFLWRWFRKNSVKRNELLIALTLESGPWGSGHWTGLFPIAIKSLASYTGLTPFETRKAIQNLEKRDFLVYDGEIMFLRGFLERQNRGFYRSEQSTWGVFYHVQRLPEDSRAVLEFIDSKRNVPELYDLLIGGLEGGLEGGLDGPQAGAIPGKV